MGRYLLNAPDDMLENWKRVAKDRGLTLAEFLRRAGNYSAAHGVTAFSSPRLTEQQQQELALDLNRNRPGLITSYEADIDSAERTFKPDFK